MSKHENTKKIILVDQVKDGKTYGTLNETYGNGNPENGITVVPITSDNSVTVKEGEFDTNFRRVGYLLPIVDANPKLIAQTDNDGLVYTPLSNAELVNDDDEVPVPQGFSYETVSLPHYYDLVPTHELAYTTSDNKSYHFYRVRMKNSPIAHIRLKQALPVPYLEEEGNESVRVFDSDSSYGNSSNIRLACYVMVGMTGVNFLYHTVEVYDHIEPDHTESPHDIIFNKDMDDEQIVHPTYLADPSDPDDPYKGTLHFTLTIDGESVDVTIETPNPRANLCELLIKFSPFIPRPSALVKLKTITFAGLIEDGALDTYNLEYVDSEQRSRKFNWVDTKKVDLDFPHAGEESFVWTQHIAPLNDVSSAVPVSDGIKGIYDVVEKAGIEMFHNTNKAIGKIHRLEQEQTVQITDDCLCILDATNADNNWYQVVHASNPTPLWIDNVAFSHLSKSGSYVDRLAILIDDTQPRETLEKVVVVSEVVQDGTVIKYKYLPFDDDNDETTPDQTQRAPHDEYSFTSYAVEQGGEELAHGKIRVVNRTDTFSEVVVIENSIAGWVDNHYFIKPSDAYMVDRGDNNGRINLYTDDDLTQKVGNGSGGDMWVKIEGAEHGLLDGTDVEDSILYAYPEKLAFLVPLPRGKDGILANLTGEAGQQGEWTISPNPKHLDEFYETLDGSRQFVILKNTDDNGYRICEVEEITFVTEGGNEEP